MTATRPKSVSLRMPWKVLEGEEVVGNVSQWRRTWGWVLGTRLPTSVHWTLVT